MSAVDYQRVILSDRVRTEAFAQAIRQAVTPGCTVVDVGCGTGFLSFLARSFGAGRCIGIERDEEFFRLAKALARTNGVDHCDFRLGHSTELRGIPEADLVISETLGNFAYEENILETLRDARRFLKPGGIMIPQGIRQYAAPVITDRHWREIVSWDRVGYGIDWSVARKKSVNNMYVQTVRPDDVLSGACWDAVDLRDPDIASVRTGRCSWTADRPVTVYGFAAWWTCALIGDIRISTAPDAPPTHWRQIVLPLESPLVVEPGDALDLELRSDSRPSVKINVRWTAEHRRRGASVNRQSMDMRNG